MTAVEHELEAHEEPAGAALPRRTDVRVIEVALRDGLQNEQAILDTGTKLRLADLLADAGLREIELTSFVSPKRVPQLADAEALFERLRPLPGVRYSALVPNERGLDRALACGVQAIALFTAASEEFARANIGMSITDSLTLFRGLTQRARGAGLRVRAYVSTAFACPFSGPTDPEEVRRVVADLLESGVDEVSVADTIGAASPDHVSRLTESLLPVLPLERFAYHFHDTRGEALANVEAAMALGVRIFDSAAGGTGGCPFAPGAPGNFATEALASRLAERGVHTGIDTDRIVEVGAALRTALSAAERT